MHQTIKLDTRKREDKYGEARIAPLRRGERNNVLPTVKVCANGAPYDLVGKTASLVATTAAGKLVGPCPMEVAQAGIARIMLPAALYSAVGAFSGYVEIREGETLVDTTDSFGGKVIECADLDSEQAAEFTPLLGELQNAVAEEAKRVEAEKARVQAETERATGFAEAKQASQAATEAANDAAADANLAAGTASDAAESANTAAGKATNAAAKAESDVRAFVNAAGTAIGDAISGAKADVDAAVKRSDTATAKAEAAAKTADAANTAATQAVSDARAAIAEVKATEAKLYPAAENILVGSETGAVAHVEDAFDGAALREITVEGATEQVTTTGKNLLNGCDAYFKESDTKIKSYLWGYTLGKNPLVLDKPLEAGTYTFSYYSGSECSIYFSKKPYVTGNFINFSCGKVVNGDTRYGLKRYFCTFTLTDSYELIGLYSENYQACFGGMIEKGSTATAYEPYTGGKPSPSPEYQQPIAVIENPTVKVVGRNLLDASLLIVGHSVDSNDGHIYTTSTNQWYANVDFIDARPMAGKQVAASGLLAGKHTNFLFYDSNERYISYVGESKEMFVFSVPDNTELMRVDMHADVYGQGTASLELAPASGSYKPHAYQTLTFTLPAEHPYLAKLPDGTADEIVVDKDGNVELVARVQKYDTTNLGAPSNVTPLDNGLNRYEYWLIFKAAPTKPDSPCMTPNFASVVNWTFPTQGCYTSTESFVVGASADPTETLKASGYLYCTLGTPKRYSLGKIDMPKAQDSIVNAWTDAEVTPNTGIKYVRDVNIVVANIESAIASITEG